MDLMWDIDKKVAAARQHPGWARFHRECAKLNFFVEKIERTARGYQAECFAIGALVRDTYVRLPLAPGVGAAPIEACMDGYRKAVAAGHMSDTHLDAVFAPAEDSLDDMIGTVEEEDLIG